LFLSDLIDLCEQFPHFALGTVAERLAQFDFFPGTGQQRRTLAVFRLGPIGFFGQPLGLAQSDLSSMSRASLPQ